MPTVPMARLTDKPVVTFFRVCVLNSLHGGKRSFFFQYVIIKSSGILLCADWQIVNNLSAELVAFIFWVHDVQMRWRWNRRKQAAPKRLYIFTNRHGVMSHKVVIFNAGAACSAVIRRGFCSAASWGCFEVTAGRRVSWRRFCILETKIVVDFALRLTVMYRSVRRHKRNIQLLIIRSAFRNLVVMGPTLLCGIKLCTSVANYGRKYVYLVLLVLSSELSLWLQQILFITYKKINFKSPSKQHG